MTSVPPSGTGGEPPNGPTPPGQQFPPPGSAYPPPPTGYQQQPWATPYGGPGPQQPPPQWGPPVHQPGVVPLRPLTLGDMFGGALKTIRHNPKATVGMATLVTFAFMLIPIIATIVLGATDSLPAMDPLATDTGSSTADIGPSVSSMVNVLFSLLAGIVVTGLIVRTVEQAVIGRPITAGEAWQQSRGRLLPLLGLVVVVFVGTVVVIGLPIAAGVVIAISVNTPVGVVIAVLGGLLGIVAAVFLYTRYVLLATPVLVLEKRGVFASMARAGQLSRRDFWRLFGIYLLASVATVDHRAGDRDPVRDHRSRRRVGTATQLGLRRPDAQLQRLQRADRRSPGSVHRRGARPAVHGPAVPQGGSRHRAAQPDLAGGAVRLLAPGPDQAREWLGEELSRSEYRESWVERFVRWVNDVIDQLAEAVGRAGQINPFVAIALTIVVAALLALVLSRLRRNVTVAEHGNAVFTQARQTAAEHRQAAGAALEQARWDEAVVESVRALAAGLVERGLVAEQADITVHELAESAAALYPSLGGRLRRTGVVFDETRYGDRPADEDRAREAVALEQEISRRTPETPATRMPATAVPR